VDVIYIMCTYICRPETDRDFDPSVEMLIHDYDDEQTMDEEEALSPTESMAGDELDDLQKVHVTLCNLHIYAYEGQTEFTLSPSTNLEFTYCSILL